MNAVPSAARDSGLTSTEATRRLREHGFNELPGHRPRTLPRILRDVLGEPMFLLLLCAAAVYLVLGDTREALVLLASICIVIAITVMQERRTERTLLKLRDLSSPRAVVIRDGREQRIAGREVVPDDLVLLHEGDRVPADGRITGSSGFSVDESILTGESLPAAKSQADDPVFSGTLVVSGSATILITATGVRSEIGRIGNALSLMVTEPTPLFLEVRALVRWVAIAGLILCALIAVVFALSRGDWLGGVLAGITIAMGVLPEEFPVILTVFLAMGAWRISRRGVLTRRMPAIETIGSVTVLAVDKTGTLTENRMKVAIVQGPDAAADLRKPAAACGAGEIEVIAVALAASEREPFDPMERAIHEAAGIHAPAVVSTLAQRRLVREYDLTPELLAVTHVWEHDGYCEVAVKGAPETVFSLCHLSPAARNQWLESVKQLAAQGLRVLGVARGRWDQGPFPDSPAGFELGFLGLLCLADPVRSTVPPALAECTNAGIRVVMITGDHPGTALAIASQAGFDTTGGTLTGAELNGLPAEVLARRVATTNIYARTTPEHKLRLIQALRANGEIVAMTGDGVNDAPALKAAHVGVAMGSRGTDVAREAADLVLVNDDFASLVGAVRLGRRIYTNIQHAMRYLIAVHIVIAGAGLVPVLLGWPLLLFPLHVLFLEFIIDPACSLVFEADPEDESVMRRKPRSPAARLFSSQSIRHSVVLGAVALLYVLAVYGFAVQWQTEHEARALAFIAMVIGNLLMILTARSDGENYVHTLARPNAMYWWITGLTLLALAVSVYLRPVADLFGFAAPSSLAVLAVLLGSATLLLAGAVSRMGSRHGPASP